MSIKELEKILNSELNLGHFYVLNLIHCEHDIETNNQLINGWINALVKKGLIIYINNTYELTEKGKEQIFNIIKENDFVKITKLITDLDKSIEKKLNLEEFAIELHSKIVNKIEKLTGKTSFKNPSGKMLNSSVMELTDRFEGFFKKYKKANAPFDKIEKVILKYVEDAITGVVKYPIRIIFYIWNEKNGGKISEMLGAIENLTEETKETEITKKVINTKEHF